MGKHYPILQYSMVLAAMSMFGINSITSVQSRAGKSVMNDLSYTLSYCLARHLLNFLVMSTFQQFRKKYQQNYVYETPGSNL